MRQSIFKTPVLLEEYLLPLLQSFCFPATSLEELSSTLLIQCLNLYYFILCSDSDNKVRLLDVHKFPLTLICLDWSSVYER